MREQKKRRDMQASAKTLAYFLTTRGGKPTTVRQASKALRVPASRLHNQLGRLVKEGGLQRIDRGLYQAAKPPQNEGLNINAFREELVKERDTLNEHIERIDHLISLRKARL